MDKFAVLLIDNYDANARLLEGSLKKAGLCMRTAVINDDGFLPSAESLQGQSEILSVYGYFLGDYEKSKTIPGHPRYFNEITVPDYWEIKASNVSGQVFNMGKEMGRIFFTEPKNKRLVKVVDWLDDKGIVRLSAHYNAQGALYARTIFNKKGEKASKSYFDALGREVIVENYVTGNITLNMSDGRVRFFNNKIDLVVYFLEVTGFSEGRIAYNTLANAFMAACKAGHDNVLFWQEGERPDVPGNMQAIFNAGAGNTKDVYVQRRNAYDALIAHGARTDSTHKLGFIYDFIRKNEHRKEILICTNSDQIESLESLVKGLPDFTFNIAAITEMSPTLEAFGSFDNVKLFPGVKPGMLDKLFARSDFYLDVNYGDEIVDAINRAFNNNMLIFSFAQTTHNKDLVAKDHIYDAKDCERLVKNIKQCAGSDSMIESGLKLQREAALSENAQTYMRVFS